MISIQSILNRKHDISYFGRLCRLCGVRRDPLIPIFDHSHHIAYQDIINSHFKDIQISKTDVLPLKLCSGCITSLMSWHQFHKKCSKTNETFLSVINDFNLRPPEPEIIFCDDIKDVEVIEVGVGSNSYDSNVNKNPLDEVTPKVGSAVPEKEEMIIDEMYLTEDDTVECREYISPLHGTCDVLTYIFDGDSVTDDAERISTNKHISQGDEFLVDVAELSGSALREQDEAEETVLGQKNDDSVLKGFILNDATTRYHCSSCFKAHVTKDELIEHIRHEHKTNIGRSEMYECDMCYEIFSRNVSRNMHRFEVHSIETPLAKDFKVVRTNCASKVEQDVSSSSYHCDRCDINFSCKGKLKVHKMRKHGVIYENARRCGICSLILLDKRALQLHMKMVHANVHETDARTKVGIGEEYLQFVSKRVVFEGGIRYFQCEECPYKCVGLHQFIRHGRRHVGVNPICDHCGKSFSTKSILRRHIALVHMGIRKFECHICGKMFGEKKHMFEHINLHQDGFNYICEVCGKQFKQMQSFAVHKQAHRGKKYSCEYCEQTFTFRSKLLNHVKKHTGINLSVCQQCDKKFTSSTHLKMHMSVHSDVKPFCCSTCGKYLKTDRSLRQHVIIFHGGKNKSSMSKEAG